MCEIAKRKAAAITAFLFAFLLFGCTLYKVSPLGHDSHTLGIAAVGDANGYNTMQAEGQLKDVRELISGKDIFIFNAEGVFSKKLSSKDCHRFKNQSLFLSSSQVIDSLPRAAITIASLANNHVLDCGGEGLLETMKEFRERGIMTVGAGEKVREACKPLILDVKGLKLAVLAYLEMDRAVLDYIGMAPDRFSSDDSMGVIASWDLCKGQKLISDIRREADIVMVFVHMHHTKFSWTEVPSTTSILFVNKILNAGADIVVGTGPHIPQGIIRSNRGVALLSLGNFLMNPDYNMPEKGHRSMLADFTMSNDRLDLYVVPLRLDLLGIPLIASQEDGGIILKRIVTLSDKLGTTLQRRGERGHLEIQRMPINSSPTANMHNAEP